MRDGRRLRVEPPPAWHASTVRATSCNLTPTQPTTLPILRRTPSRGARRYAYPCTSAARGQATDAAVLVAAAPAAAGETGATNACLSTLAAGAVEHARRGLNPGGNVGGLETGREQGCFQLDPMAQEFSLGFVVGVEARADELSVAGMVEAHPPGESSVGI